MGHFQACGANAKPIFVVFGAEEVRAIVAKSVSHLPAVEKTGPDPIVFEKTVGIFKFLALVFGTYLYFLTVSRIFFLVFSLMPGSSFIARETVATPTLHILAISFMVIFSLMFSL